MPPPMQVLRRERRAAAMREKGNGVGRLPRVRRAVRRRHGPLLMLPKEALIATEVMQVMPTAPRVMPVPPTRLLRTLLGQLQGQSEDESHDQRASQTKEVVATCRESHAASSPSCRVQHVLDDHNGHVESHDLDVVRAVQVDRNRVRRVGRTVSNGRVQQGLRMQVA